MIDYDNKDKFTEFLEANRETSKAFPTLTMNKPFDLSPREFDSLKKITLSFESYEKFWLMYHNTTKELFLGDINTGGHGAQWRIVKIYRSQILTNQKEMHNWYENWAYKMWLL